MVAGPGRRAAVGHFLFGQQFGQGTAWTSPDGKTWTRMPDQASFGQGEPQAVIPDGAGYVAAGTVGAPDNYILTVWLSPSDRQRLRQQPSRVSGLDALLALHVVDGPAQEDEPDRREPEAVRAGVKSTSMFVVARLITRIAKADPADDREDPRAQRPVEREGDVAGREGKRQQGDDRERELLEELNELDGRGPTHRRARGHRPAGAALRERRHAPLA